MASESYGIWKDILQYSLLPGFLTHIDDIYKIMSDIVSIFQNRFKVATTMRAILESFQYRALENISGAPDIKLRFIRDVAKSFDKYDFYTKVYDGVRIYSDHTACFIKKYKDCVEGLEMMCSDMPVLDYDIKVYVALWKYLYKESQET